MQRSRYIVPGTLALFITLTTSEVAAGFHSPSATLGMQVQTQALLRLSSPRAGALQQFFLNKARTIARMAHPTATLYDYDVAANSQSVILSFKYRKFGGDTLKTDILYRFASDGTLVESTVMRDTALIFGAFDSLEFTKRLAGELLAEHQREKAARGENVSWEMKLVAKLLRDDNVDGNRLHQAIVNWWWSTSYLKGRYRSASW